MHKSRRQAYLFLLANTVIWGLAIPIVKKGFSFGLDPKVFLFARFLIAALLSIPLILPKLNQPKAKITLKPKNIFTIALLEISSTVIALTLLYEGLARTTAVEASLIAITWPIFLTIGAVLFLKEKEETHELLGLIIAIIGTLILVISPLSRQGLNFTNLFGNTLIIAQNIVIAIYYLLAKKYYLKFDKWLVTHISFWVGTLGMAAILIINGTNLLTSLTNLLFSGQFWPLFAVFYMGLAGSILGFTFYLLAQDKIEASEASLFTYLQPIFAIPTAILILSENINLSQTLGILVIAFGVYLAEIRPKTSGKKLSKMLK